MNLRNQGRGFTLVELLIVIALIALVSGMVIGLFGSAVQKSAATTSLATQKQLVNQFNSYMQLHGNALPDGFDTLIADDVSAGSYTTLGTYSVIGEGSFDLNVGDDPTLFFAQPVAPGASTSAQFINRGLSPDSYSGADRTLCVKELNSNDVRVLEALGITTLYDLDDRDLFYGEHRTVSRTAAVGGAICVVDPESVAGQRLYRDFGVDLSDTSVYTRKGADDSGTAWDDTEELDAAGRLAAMRAQLFYVLAVGPNSRLIGDGLAGVQEAPTSGVVVQGYYNRFALVIKRGASSGGDRNPGLAGVLDPRGRGASAARQAVNAIQ